MSDEMDTAPEQEAETPQPHHVGNGRYAIPGVENVFPSLAAAHAYLAVQEARREEDEEFGARLPKDFKVTDRTLLYRGSVMELPMNERYLPEGDRSPYYDREYIWAWGRLDGVDIATKRARGYRPVTLKDLQAAIKAGKVPEHYESLLHFDGNYLLYGDAVLLRMPRVLWNERLVEREARALKQVAKTEQEVLNDADNHNIPLVNKRELPVQNEFRSGLVIKS